MSAPLPQTIAAPQQRPPAGHTGLWFDKFCHQWQLDPSKHGLESWTLKSFIHGQGGQKTEKNPKLLWIQTVTQGKVGDSDLLTEYTIRSTALVHATGGQALHFKTHGRFATGLGREHPIENGFAWHPALGVPYLPGSSVKGLVRAWAATWAGADQTAVARIFGAERSDHVGSVIFHGAIPTKPIQLAADVMTPHYGPYYEKKEAPGDWHSPVPIPFLTVADGQSFLFTLAPRTPLDSADCQQAAAWLKQALLELGAGAKTAVGYGRFVPDPEAAASARKKAEQQKAFADSIAHLSPLARELVQKAQEQNWETDTAAFKKQGVREEWMARLEADPQPDAIRYFGKLIEKHDKGILANPDRKEGKKNKPAYKDTSIAIAKKWNALPKP